MKIGIIIPSTSNGREWTTYKETYLYNHTIKSFLLTYDKEHEYVFYIGIDRNDRIYDNEDVKREIKRFISVMKNVSIEFVYMEGMKKGHLTVMWNKLAEVAYKSGCQFFFQCGDDIEFKTKGWVNDCLKVLSTTNGIGLVGPVNNNPRILTQSFVSRRHLQLFGYYFPPEIFNWFCDDWINAVYRSIKHFYPLKNQVCVNIGGTPRYLINDDPEFINDKTSEKFNQELYKEKHKLLKEEANKIIERDVKRILTPSTRLKRPLIFS